MTRFNTPDFWYRPQPGWRANLLRPCAWLYGLALAVHRASSRSIRLPVPVVSIGNITLGGTGKTPLVIALAREFVARGWHPAVISRGYGSGRRMPLQVQLGHGVAQVGDEALEIAASLRGAGVPVWVGSDRVASARRALAQGADVLLLDDGLQHWRLARDCDLTLLDAGQRLGNGLTFPAGPLREPAQDLARAQLLVLTGAGVAHPDGLPWPLRRPWVAVPSALAVPPHLLGQPLLAFCGLGLPQKFFAALRRHGCQLVACEVFPDHHPYAREDLERLLALARANGNATLVTTAKDWHRLVDLLQGLPAGRVEAIPLLLEPAAVSRLMDLVLAQLGDGDAAGRAAQLPGSRHRG